MNPRQQMMMMDPRVGRFEDADGEEGYIMLDGAEQAEKMVDADFHNKFNDLYDVEDLD